MNENIVNERKILSATKFQDKNEIGRISVAKIGLASGVVEDFFGQERV